MHECTINTFRSEARFHFLGGLVLKIFRVSMFMLRPLAS